MRSEVSLSGAGGIVRTLCRDSRIKVADLLQAEPFPGGRRVTVGVAQCYHQTDLLSLGDTQQVLIRGTFLEGLTLAIRN